MSMSGPAVTDAGLRKRSARRNMIIAASAVLLLLLAILLPPYINIGRYRRSIAGIVSRSLGRPVHIGSVQLRLLPMPGIEMSDFEVEEAPGFGAEPALRASSVVATLRLSSLWRGRLEVSRISLEDTSLNLVRNAKGRWSIGSVLDQAAHISNAPTAQLRPGNAPRFPYIEATDARINFKDGLEKKPFSLMNAEFSAWLDTPDEWHIRLKAQPARTDLDPNLSDAGQLTVEGSMHRAAALNAMPVNLEAEWRGAQLGQVSRLFMAVDTGWRGDLDISATLTGEIGRPHIKSRIRIANVHRQEFEPSVSVDVDARCEGDPQAASRSVENLTCFWPTGTGHLLLTGNLRRLRQPHDGQARSDMKSDLKLEINHAPASLAVNLLGLMRQRAGNVTATGAISGEFQYTTRKTETTEAETLTGQATVDEASLFYPGLDRPLPLPSLHFTASPTPLPPRPPAHAKPRPVRGKPHPPKSSPAPVSIVLQNFPVSLGAEAPLNVSGVFARSGFSLNFSGQAALDRLLSLSHDFGLMQPSLALVTPLSDTANPQSGAASRSTVALDLTVQGPWLIPVADQDHPELATTTLGSAQIKNVQVKADFLPEPLEVSAATIDLASGVAAWNNVSAIFHRIPLHGSVSYRTGCAPSAACPVDFIVDTPSVSAAALQSALMGAGDHGELLDAILARIGGQHHPWPALQGSIRIAALQLGALPLRNVEASLFIAGTSVRIASLDAQALGGTVHATGNVDTAGSANAAGSTNTSAAQPLWKLDLQLSHISAAEAASLFRRQWGAGTISAEAHLTTHGFREEALSSSSEGDFHFDWQNGTLPAALTPAGQPPHFDRWTADGTIGSTALTLTRSQAFHGKQSVPISGTIPFREEMTTLAAKENAAPAQKSPR
jgi:hypothetical protein